MRVLQSICPPDRFARPARIAGNASAPSAALLPTVTWDAYSLFRITRLRALDVWSTRTYLVTQAPRSRKRARPRLRVLLRTAQCRRSPSPRLVTRRKRAAPARKRLACEPRVQTARLRDLIRIRAPARSAGAAHARSSHLLVPARRNSYPPPVRPSRAYAVAQRVIRS